MPQLPNLSQTPAPVYLCDPTTGQSLQTSGGITNRSGVVTTGGTAVTIAANASRRYLRLTNPGTLAHQFATGGTLESLWFDMSGTAAVNGPNSTELVPGATFAMEGSFVATGAVSIVATTSLHRFVAKEG